MSNFQRRHYQAIAEAMKETQPKTASVNHYNQWKIDLVAIATVFKKDNPSFNMEKFFTACGIE